MQGKVCLVTGANSGVGYGTTLGLANQGARVVMLCRNKERGESARYEILKRTGCAPEHLDLMLCDLSSRTQIRQFAETFQTKYEKLDVLINNAAIVPPRRQMAEDGLEMQFAVNVLAPFMLTHLLMEQLQQSESARVVSLSALPYKSLQPRLHDIQSESHYHIRGWRAYSHTKIWQSLFTIGLAERLQKKGLKITSNGVHPGVVNTGIIKVNGFLRWIMQRFFFTPEEGARSVIYAATSPELEGKNGVYIKWNSDVIPIAGIYEQSVIETAWQTFSELSEMPVTDWP